MSDEEKLLKAGFRRVFRNRRVATSHFWLQSKSGKCLSVFFYNGKFDGLYIGDETGEFVKANVSSLDEVIALTL